MPVFGEKILVKPAGKGKRGDPAKMVEGRYVGTHNRFGSVLAMTKTGVVVALASIFFRRPRNGVSWRRT